MSLGNVTTTDVDPLALLPTIGNPFVGSAPNIAPTPIVPPAPILRPIPIPPPVQVVRPAPGSTSNTVQVIASTSRASSSQWPGSDPARPIGVAKALERTANRANSRALLRRIFGESDNYVTDLQSIVQALNTLAQNPPVQGQSPFTPIGNRLLRVQLPTYGDIVFAVNHHNELDSVRRMDSDTESSRKNIEQMLKNIGKKRSRRNYADHLRHAYGQNSPARQALGGGVRTRDGTLNHTRIQVPAIWGNLGQPTRLQGAARRFQPNADVPTVLTRIAQDVNALLLRAQQQNRPLAIRHPESLQSNVIILDVPDTPGQRSFIRAPYTLLLRLDASGRIIDFDRGDPTLHSAVESMRTREPKPPRQ